MENGEYECKYRSARCEIGAFSVLSWWKRFRALTLVVRKQASRKLPSRAFMISMRTEAGSHKLFN